MPTASVAGTFSYRTTNETGFQDFVITPVYGFGWNVGEDAIDRYIMPAVHRHVKNRFYLTTQFWMTPCKAAANVLRWKPMYYRTRLMRRRLRFRVTTSF